jgi:hypothetical protein
MAKLGEARPAAADSRADSTLDQLNGDPVAALGAIAAEEIAENEAVAAQIEAQQQAEADAEMAALVEGWQEAMKHAADVITSISPDLKPIWSAERMNNVGAALARCDAHYGWGGAAKLISHPLVGLGVASAPVVIGTVKWAQAEKVKNLARIREQRAAALAGAPQGPAQPAKSDAKAPVNAAAMMDESLQAA